MGSISKKLHRRMAKESKHLPTKEPKRRSGEPLPGGVKDIQSLINDGLDPVHAAYSFIQQMSSIFAEGVFRATPQSANSIVSTVSLLSPPPAC